MPPAYESLKLERRARLFLAGACLIIFATALETRNPVISLGFVNFTNSELAAGLFFITAAVWAITVPGDFFKRRVLDLGVALFLASNYLSVLSAADRGTAFKFSLRMTFAAMVYVGISRLPARKRSHLVVAGAAALTLALVTAVGLLESFGWPVDWTEILAPWHEGIITFGTFFNVRISSTLPYPTTLSMYLELILPLGLVFLLWLTRENSCGGRRSMACAAVTATIMAAIVAVMVVQLNTYTRSALVATPLSMWGAALLAAIYGYSRRVFRYFALVGIIFILLTAFMTVFSNELAVRLGLAKELHRYAVEYTMLDFPAEIRPGSAYTARARLTNTSEIDWPAEGKERVYANFFWLNYPEKKILENLPDAESSLPREVAPGDSVEMDINFHTPDVPGKYVLLIELIKSHVGPFSVAGVQPLAVPIEIGLSGSRNYALSSYDTFTGAERQVSTPARKQLWRAALLAWKSSPVLGLGADQFRWRYPEFAPELRHDERVGAHNIFLEAMANTGLAGLLAMVFLLASAVWASLRLVRDRSMPERKGMRLAALAMLSCLIAYIAHGLLDYFLWQTGVAFLFFAELGLIAWLSHVWENAKKEGAPA